MVLTNKVILITGGTGSIGNCFIRYALGGEQGVPKRIIVFSRDENKQFHMQRSTEYAKYLHLLDFRIGDVRDYHAVCSVLQDVDIVVNAAALKHVPVCEYFPEQAILTNCLGAVNIVRAISENKYPVKVVLCISTDKACKPVNVMGMSKAIQERVFIAANLYSDTRFVGVRYGNVLASRGSVVPLFLSQIRDKLPITITDSTMTRFLLSQNQAVGLILTAIQEANQGEIYVPNVPSATVFNIAQALIQNQDSKIESIGVRPGEKMHEVLISEEEIGRCCKRGEYFVILPALPEIVGLYEFLRPCGFLRKEFSSSDNVLSLLNTKSLFKKHGIIESTF